MASSSSAAAASTSSTSAAKKFSNDFSKAIADALLERDNPKDSNSTTTSATAFQQQHKEQLIRDAYIALCYDDPRVESDEACRLLAQELLRSSRSLSGTMNTNNKYALSERLVEGIRQATRRFDVGVQPQIQSPQQPTDGDDPNTDIITSTSTTTTTTTGATAVGYSILAMAVFGQIPLKCCQSANLREVQEWLGSYRGPAIRIESNTITDSIPDTTTMMDDVQMKLKTLNLLEDDNVVQSPTESITKATEVLEPPEPINPHDDTEIWAEESDASDFVYESDAVDWTAWYSSSNNNNINNETDGDVPDMLWGMTIDPDQLSQPMYTDDWSHVQQAVSNLLQNLTHEIFFPLSATVWNQYHVSEQLTQLTLVLLLEGGDSSNNANDDTTSNDRNKMMADGMLQRWSIQPINVLRDRVLIDMDSRCLQDYLSLVQSLIAAVDVTTPSSTERQQRSDTKMPVAMASMVGLASLSSLCSQAKQLKEIPIIRKCVLESCEDLCSLVEKVSQSLELPESPTTTTATDATTQTSSSMTPPSWVSTIWALLPLLEIIANIQADGTMLDSSRYTSIPAASDSQWLLNSGFFRALILLYTKTAKYSSSTSAVTAATTSLSINTARHQLLQCLQMLSLQNMSLLGKYAWRVPELNALIHEVEYQSQHVVDGLIWSLMGQQLGATSSSSSSTHGTLRLRNPTTTTAIIIKKPVTAEESKGTAQSQWQLLCDQLLTAIQTISELRQTGSRDRLDNTRIHNDVKSNNNDWKEPIIELTRFTNCLVSCDALSPLWRQAMLSQPNGLMKKQLEQLQKALVDLPSPPASPKESSSSSSATIPKTADNDKAGNPLERPNPSFEAEVGMVRRAIKVATMSLTQQDETSTTRRGLASKTD